MKIRQLLYILFTAALFVSCEKNLEGLRNNPNNPDLSSADVDLYLNQAQISFNIFRDNDPEFNFAINDFALSFVRMEVMYGPLYQNAYSADNYDRTWRFAYTGVLKHINALLTQALEKKLYMHAGIAQILKAYTAITLVDNFGDVPFFEANAGSKNLNPKADKGSDIYINALALLDSAIVNFNKNAVALPLNDLFYNSDKDKWITCAKTLKLRYYLTTRLLDAAAAKTNIEELLIEGDLIDTDEEEFVFRYGSQQENPSSRHPKYVRNYRDAGGTQDYIGTYLMWTLTQEKGIPDPRTRYYFYRQTLQSDGWDAFTLQCGVQPRPAHYTADMPFCILPNGYWGRDHGDASGIPPDQEIRTTWGVYPAGGKFDNSEGVSAVLNEGAKGMGISPIWLANYTDFAKAEAALTLQTAGNPKELLEAGVRKSIARVIAFPAELGITVPINRIPTPAVIDAYVAKVLALYDNAITIDDKLNVIMKEWYLALWGNGVDAYNNYRRTTKPSDFQFTNAPASGNFVRTFYYPADFANLNASGSQKPGTNVKTFWDINPDNLYR